jgi:hypothetical protein
MFAVKNMDLNSNLLTLKLDMVYRDFPLEAAQARYSEITNAVPPPTAPDAPPKPKTILKRKAVKPVVRKST